MYAHGMDLVFNIILIGLVAWHVALAVAFSAWCGWEMILHPAWKLWLRLKPVPPTQPTLDLREARI